jgi:hypothetical protein
MPFGGAIPVLAKRRLEVFAARTQYRAQKFGRDLLSPVRAIILGALCCVTPFQLQSGELPHLSAGFEIFSHSWRKLKPRRVRRVPQLFSFDSLTQAEIFASSLNLEIQKWSGRNRPWN